MRGPRWAGQEELLGVLTFVIFNPTGSPASSPLCQSRSSTGSHTPRGVQGAGCGGIVVLLVVLLAMNSVPIWLRNRFYQRRW
jgi:phosphate transport system permease protein